METVLNRYKHTDEDLIEETLWLETQAGNRLWHKKTNDLLKNFNLLLSEGKTEISVNKTNKIVESWKQEKIYVKS